MPNSRKSIGGWPMTQAHTQPCPACEMELADLPAAALYCPRCGTRLGDGGESLNPQQRQAVEVTDGPVAVIAGAGSGKTRVIEYRVLNLVRKGIVPQSILLLTFTRRAAREMTFRAASHDPRCRYVWGGTFHSFANQVIREFAEVLGISPAFRILDSVDASEAIGRCQPTDAPAIGNGRLPNPQTLRLIFSKAATTGRSIGQVVQADYPHFLEAAPAIVALHDAYRRFKRDSACLDFDDLLSALLELVRNKAVRDRLASRYRYIMVDEYQDTNTIEAEVACLLGAVHGNLMIVGDDAQSIYGFRGADYRNILAFTERFPNCRIVKLEQNYRSTQPILDLANALIEGMSRKYTKCLRSAGGEAGEKPVLVLTDDERSEAQWIADQIRRNQAAGVDLHRQAVLYRSSFVSDVLQLLLRERQVPFRVVGGPPILEAPHVKAFLAYLQLLADHRDVLAWGRVLSSAGLGHREARRLSEMLARCDDLAAACEYLLSTQRHAEKVVALAALLRQVDSASPPPADRCAMVAEFFTPILKQHYDDWPDRIENINSLCRMAVKYQDLAGMLKDLVVDAVPLPSDSSAADQRDMLTLSTVHSAKGLEWDVVYVMGMTDGVFPDRRSIGEADSLEEERRLLYVAVTRARRKLMLASRGGRLCRFLRDSRAGSRLTTMSLESPVWSATTRQEVRVAPRSSVPQQEMSRPATDGAGRKGCLLGWFLGLLAGP